MAREKVSSCLETFSGQERLRTKGTGENEHHLVGDVSMRVNKQVGPTTILLAPFFPRLYEECSDLRRVVRQLSFYQDEHNIGGNGAEMSLVFFPDAVRHLLRISRILRQPRGNAILIGLAGDRCTGTCSFSVPSLCFGVAAGRDKPKQCSSFLHT